MIKFQVRQGTIQDVNSLIPLLKQLFSIEADFSFNDTIQRQGLELMLTHPEERCILVAEVNQKIIGMCTAQLIITTAEGGKAALIEDVVVDEGFRHQGVGQELMTAIEQWALTKGAKRLELLADRENTPALQFYQKLNWKQTQLVCLHKKSF